MTHIELLTLLNKNKNTIDQAYRDGYIDSVSDELFNSTLFTKTSKGYELNRSYINFVNTILDRVDYSIVFGDYEKEHSLLIKSKIKYQETKKDYYKNDILNRIDEIFFKFLNRDREIKALLYKLENEVSLDIDIIIENAHSILDQIIELIDANEKISKTFRELKTIDKIFKEVISNLDEDFYRFIKNINIYIDTLNKFIVQTKQKRKQNRLFLKLSNDILDEKDEYLNEYLKINSPTLHTLKYKYKKDVLFVSDDNKKLLKAIKNLELLKPPKKLAPNKINIPKPEKLEIIELDEILDSLKDGCDDLYMFLIDKVGKEAFRVYLSLLEYENIEFCEGFNQHNIRIVKWLV